MTIDLDKFEALARAATRGPWGKRPWDDKRFVVGFIDAPNIKGQEALSIIVVTSGTINGLANAEYVAALNPVVVLQWIAETRANTDKLRVAVEALEKATIQCDDRAHYCASCLNRAREGRAVLKTLSAPTGDKVE